MKTHKANIKFELENWFFRMYIGKTLIRWFEMEFENDFELECMEIMSNIKELYLQHLENWNKSLFMKTKWENKC